MNRRALVLTLVALALCVMASLASSIGAPPARAGTAYPAVNLVINGKPIKTDVPAQLIGGRTMVPARAVFETLAARVDWDGATRTVTVAYLSHSISVRIGSHTATVDGCSVALDVGPIIVNDRTLVPLRFIAEAIGATVGWLPDSRTATVELRPTVDGITWEEGPGHGTLHIDATGAIEPNVCRQTAPDRIVVDIPGALLSLPAPVAAEPDQNVTGLTAVADATGVHVTLGLTGPANYALVKRDAGADIEVGYRIGEVTYQSGSSETVLVRISGPTAYRRMELTAPNRLVLDFDLATLTAPVNLTVDSQYIRSIRAAQFSLDPAVARVVIEFRGDAMPVGIKSTAEGLELTVSPQYAAAVAGRTIYIDPGHGGSDPGAIGVSGTHESDVNLDTAKRLQSLLAAAGANAVLTRSGDYDVGLYDRPEMANAANADLFISLHNNWYESASVAGTQVYYYVTNPDSKSLAATVHDALIAELGRPDRGVLTANFAVIRVAQMPSILVESAFLSNPEEDGLLRTPEFRQEIAQAVYDGIVAYYSAAQ